MNQAARMIEWLDEERRRDKTLISTLEERLAQQQDGMDTLQRRLNSIESDQTVMRDQFVPNTHEREIIEQMRKEMGQVLENSETKRLNAEREAERRAGLDRETLSKPVQELTDKISRLEKTTTEVPMLQIERERLAAAIATLQQRLDDLVRKQEEPERRLAFLEEQRRQDARRISEIEANAPEIKKQVDSLRPKTVLLEDLMLRTERRIQELQDAERERREQIQQFIDQQGLQLQQRDQQIEELVQRFSEQDSSMLHNMERFETWSETYREMRQITEDFQRIGDRLERRINEVAEMQRLSEERFRQEWNDWRADDQKRWKQFTLSNDEVWRGYDDKVGGLSKFLDGINERLAPLHDSLDRMWKLERQRATLYSERYQELLREFDPTESGDGNSASQEG